MQKVSTSNVVNRDHRKPMRFSDFKQCRQKKTLAIEVITDEMPLSDVCQDGKY